MEPAAQLEALIAPAADEVKASDHESVRDCVFDAAMEQLPVFVQLPMLPGSKPESG
jgi:hypothetical protein